MFLIGITGGSGSGKSTFVMNILERFKEDELTVIRQDSYYKDNSQTIPALRQEINFDHPDAIEFGLLEEHIVKLKNRETIYQPVYSFQTCTRTGETIKVEPNKVILLEGILIFTPGNLRELMDIKVFIDADEEVRLKRIIERDIHERGRSVDNVLERYEKTVKPMHLQFVEPARQYADIIVPKGGENKEAINLIQTIIEQKLLRN